VIRRRAVLAAMGLKQEAFYILIWAMVAIGVVIMFDRTGRLALLIFAFGAVAALCGRPDLGDPGRIQLARDPAQVRLGLYAHLANASRSGALY
jgi:hypothetical protein